MPKPYNTIIVDDDIEFIAWLKSLLGKSNDFNVVGKADNGNEALNLVESVIPDLLISDVYLPDIDGLEIARIVKRKFQNVKVILISANEEKVYSRLVKEMGSISFIAKINLSLESLRLACQSEG